MPLASNLIGIVFDPMVKYFCPTDTDIAGIRVVLSFVIAAILTTAASIAAAVLDAAVLDENAFLPYMVQRWLNRGLNKDRLDRCRSWRQTLERLILAFADQQLVTGFALLICGYIYTFPGLDNSLSAHWNLVVYLSCLSGCTHLACVLTLRNYFEDHRAIFSVRLVLIILFSLLLMPAIVFSHCFRAFLFPISMLITREMLHGRSFWVANTLWYGFQICIMLYLFGAAIMQLLPRQQKRLKTWITYTFWFKGLHRWLRLKHLGLLLRKFVGNKTHNRMKKVSAGVFWYCVFLTPGTIFTLQIAFAILALVYTLLQKFSRPTRTDDVEFSATELCSLNTTAENAWVFGQLLAMILLALPVLSAWETYIEGKYQPHKSRNTPLVSTKLSYFEISSESNVVPLIPGSSHHELLSPPLALYNNPEVLGVLVESHFGNVLSRISYTSLLGGAVKIP